MSGCPTRLDVFVRPSTTAFALQHQQVRISVVNSQGGEYADFEFASGPLPGMSSCPTTLLLVFVRPSIVAVALPKEQDYLRSSRAFGVKTEVFLSPAARCSAGPGISKRLAAAAGRLRQPQCHRLCPAV